MSSTVKPTVARFPDLDEAELGMVLAGLRLIQRQGVPDDLIGIATNAGSFDPLNDDEIDDLCVKIAERPAPAGFTSKHAFTAGPCVATGELSTIGDTVHWCGEVIQVAPDNGYRGRVVGIQSCNHIGGIGNEEAEANASLIAEAFTVAHETGLTPRQLAERCETLLGELKQARSYVAVIAAKTSEPRVHDDLKKIDAAIAGTGGAK